MSERTVLVTGASSGFGRAMVGRLLAADWRVLATLRQAPARRDLFAAELAAHPGSLEVLSLDVASAAEREAMAAALAARPEGLQAFVSNAGYGLFGPLEELTEAQLRDQLEVNLVGAALLTRALLPALRRARGRIVFVSSLLGARGLPLTSAYCASKFALEGLAESLYHELRPLGVQVAIVQPGGHRTGFGDHAAWGEASVLGSPYARRVAAYRERLAGRRSRPAPGPEPVARAVERLLAAGRMPLRVRVGADSRLSRLLGRLLPEHADWRAWGALVDRAIPTSPSGAAPAAALPHGRDRG